MGADEFISKSFYYWESFFEFAEDLTDGAWWAAHEDGFSGESLSFCCDLLELPVPEGDENDLTHAYLRKKSALKEVGDGSE